MGHSEENKTDELESEEFILSKKTQEEGDADDLVNTDTGTDTDISETYKRDHSEEFEENKEKTCNTKIMITKYDDEDLIQSDNDQHTNNEVSEGKDLIIEKTKNVLELGHSEENRRDELKSKELILSNNKQREEDADDLVDTDTDTDTDTDIS